MNNNFIISFVIMALAMFFESHVKADNVIPSSYFNPSDIESVESIVSFEKNKEGDWVSRSSHSLKSIPPETELWVNGKVIKKREIYAMVCSAEPGVIFTDFLKITFKKDGFQKYAANPDIEEINPKEIEMLVDQQSWSLESSFLLLNEQHREERDLADRERKKREDEEIKRREYRQAHKPHELDISSYIETCRRAHASTEFFCRIKDCKYDYDSHDPILNIVGVKNDTIITTSVIEGPLGISYKRAHLFNMDDRFFCNPDIHRHLIAWEDSLQLSGNMRKEADRLNQIEVAQLIAELKRKAPCGFIKGYTLITDTDPATLDVDFFNTSDKTIQTIIFSYTLQDEGKEGEINGEVEGNGPVEILSGKNWILEVPIKGSDPKSATIEINKVTIRYDDGAEVTLRGNTLMFDK